MISFFYAWSDGRIELPSAPSLSHQWFDQVRWVISLWWGFTWYKWRCQSFLETLWTFLLWVKIKVIYIYTVWINLQFLKNLSCSCNILRFACKKHAFLARLHHDFPIRARVWSWLWNVCTSLTKISNFRLRYPNRSFFPFYLMSFLECLKGTLQQWAIAHLQILRLHKVHLQSEGKCGETTVLYLAEFSHDV